MIAFSIATTFPGSWGVISNLFEIKKPPIGQIKYQNGVVEVSCKHPSGKNQTREITHESNSIVIRDKLVLEEPVVGFMFKKDVVLVETRDECIIKIGDVTISHSPKPIEVKIYDFENSKPDITNPYDGNTYYSPSYGVIKSGARVEFIHKQGELAKTIISEKGS